MSLQSDRSFGLPESLEKKIPKIIQSLGFDVTRPKELSVEILKLSNHFNSAKRGPTPWTSPGAQAAYLAYFFPLQYTRNLAAKDRGESVGFFQGLQSIVDFGSGPGCASLAFEDLFHEQNIVEVSAEARLLHQKFAAAKIKSLKEIPKLNRGLGVFSYVLNEMSELPAGFYDLEAIMILEPSTHQEFSGLLAYRKNLIENGYSIWAPCAHQEKCPLGESKDWCHDRVLFKSPAWWKNLEAELPMKNRTITFAYLLARKGGPSEAKGLARITGDTLEEKGKTRQLICRGPEREFLSWLHREGEPPQFSRGTLVELQGDWSKKSNELRGGQVRVCSTVPSKLK